MNIKWLLAKSMKYLLHPPALRSCRVHKTAKVGPATELTGVEVGRYTYLGSRCFAVNAEIGSFCSIADNCRIGGAAHEMRFVSTSPVFCEGKNIMRTNLGALPSPRAEQTRIGHDVWLGAGCQIKSGVTVHTGAVIGMGSIVTKDVPPYEIWAGNPARKIRDRFDAETKRRLLASAWWELPDDRLRALAGHFDQPDELCRILETPNGEEI